MENKAKLRSPEENILEYQRLVNEQSRAGLSYSKAFFIPKDDVINMYNELLEIEQAGDEQIEGFRAYIGITEELVQHLYFVFAQSVTQDHIEIDPNDHYIYDFTTPCPDTCAVDSPYYLKK